MNQARVARGLAAGWPAIERWSFEALAARLPDRRIQLVAGNREHGKTQFVSSDLSHYLRGLSKAPEPGSGPPLYLKEFDLLKAAPDMHTDLRPEMPWPSRGIVANSAWIGPAGARTGLHHDLLDNVAVVLRGRKRFRWAAPGTVEALCAPAAKYDRWAVLSRCSADELHAAGLPLGEAELVAGDAIFLPRGWWHEVENLEASILLSGFHGSVPRVLGLWAWTGCKQLLHQIGLFGRAGCTCHPQRQQRSAIARAQSQR